MARDKQRRGRVIKRARTMDGIPIGRSHGNPLLDISEYEIELEDDESTQRYHANVIAENMLSQVDSEGSSFCIFERDYRSLEAAMPVRYLFPMGLTQVRMGIRCPRF